MPRPDVSDERRPQIIAAAIKVFLRKGYRKATMPDIAREAGLSIGGVYWYFKGKDDVVLAILEDVFKSDLDDLNLLVNTETNAGERLKSFISAYVENYNEMAWLNTIGIEFYGEAAHDPVVRGFIQQYVAHYRQALLQLIEQGVARGEFRAVDPVAVANALIGLEEGLSLIKTADPQGVDWKQSFQTAAELILIGLTTKEN